MGPGEFIVRNPRSDLDAYADQTPVIPIVAHGRLAGNRAHERTQPYHGQGTIDPRPLNLRGAAGVISIISTGPTGVGASYEMTEPGIGESTSFSNGNDQMNPGGSWHQVVHANPLVSRATGA